MKNGKKNKPQLKKGNSYNENAYVTFRTELGNDESDLCKKLLWIKEKLEKMYFSGKIPEEKDISFYNRRLESKVLIDFFKDVNNILSEDKKFLSSLRTKYRERHNKGIKLVVHDLYDMVFLLETTPNQLLKDSRETISIVVYFIEQEINELKKRYTEMSFVCMSTPVIGLSATVSIDQNQHVDYYIYDCDRRKRAGSTMELAYLYDMAEKKAKNRCNRNLNDDAVASYYSYHKMEQELKNLSYGIAYEYSTKKWFKEMETKNKDNLFCKEIQKLINDEEVEENDIEEIKTGSKAFCDSKAELIEQLTAGERKARKK